MRRTRISVEAIASSGPGLPALLWTSFALASLWLLASCGSAGPASLRQLEADRLERLTEARPEAAGLPVVEREHRIRWNPAACECPPWEIFLDQEWLRLNVKATGDRAEAVIEAYEAEPTSEPKEWRARGVVRAGTAVSAGPGQSAVVADLSWIGEGTPPVIPPED